MRLSVDNDSKIIPSDGRYRDSARQDSVNRTPRSGDVTAITYSSVCGFLLRFFVTSFILSFTFALPCAHSQTNAATLRDVLARGQAALAAGDYASAYAAFETIQTTFGEEPEVRAESFRRTVLPLHGYAALLSGNPGEAIELFRTFVREFPNDRTRKSFVLFNLARAQSEAGEDTGAIETYRSFVALDPNRPEAALASLEAARLMFENNRGDEGFDTLDTLYRRTPPGVLRTKARLTALQEALALGRVEQARDYMLATEWSVTDMPELAVLAFAAMEMGHQLLAARDYAAAIRCYRLVPPYRNLVAAQERRLEETRQRFESRKSEVGLYQGGQFWTQFYTRLIGRLEGQLKGLREAEDYSTSLYLSYGQAYLLGGRPREAWIMFEHLARDPVLSPEQQAEAHYRWILAAIEVGVWEDAFKIARGFGRRFPDSPLVPNALYLLGTAYQDARQYADAVEVFSAFLARHADHALAPRALFVRGYNYNLMNRPVEAREDFERFMETYPENGLYPDARFWRALTFFAERDYEAALEALAELAPDVEGGRLEPEVAYRRASTLYAKQNYEAALGAIEAYLENYPRHAKVDEGRVLLGDIQMGRGELSTARTIFAGIPPSAGPLFTYAVFQAGKILRAVADADDTPPERRETLLENHRDHFLDYLTREDVPDKSRISDALYWVGWTYIEQGEPERARKVFEDALAQYGDDIESGQVLNIIDALAKIEKRLTDLNRRERGAALKAWIAEEKERALEDERLTYFARLNLYLDSMIPPDEPTRIIFETVEKVPIEKLDAENLGHIAAALAETYPRLAEDYLVRLEEEYPDSRHRSFAYYARARLLMREGDDEAARRRLARFRAESPMHPLATEVALHYAATLTQAEDYGEAREVLEEILRMRQAKGRPHARALLALSRNAEAAGKLERAVPYAQRVFNVYRAYPELAAKAYLMSARQFELLGDDVAAYKTLDEMLEDDRLAALPVAPGAREKRDALFESLPEGALDEPPAAEAAAAPAENEKAEVPL